MKAHRRFFFGLMVLAILLAIAACSPAAPTQEYADQAPAAAAPAQSDPEMQPPAPQAPMEMAAPPPAPDQAGARDNTVYNTGPAATAEPGGGPAAPASGRKIIKNAELQLLVADTDTAIDRVTQAVQDVGGYIVSSKSWYQDEVGGKYKYCTLTLGVPVDDFERALRRLRDASLQVLNEVATGEDVSQEYVDLQSRLESLQATRARITGFLKDAKTVEEALKINDQLAAVEQQINETMGRMNYLSGRASFSTITVTLNPQIKDITATPTATPTITPTPTATPTATPWQPGKTLSSAGSSLGQSYRVLVEGLIWFFVYLLPILLPWVGLGVLIWWLVRRGRKKAGEGTLKTTNDKNERQTF